MMTGQPTSLKRTPPPRDRASPRAYRPAVSINKALYSTIVSEGSTLEGGRLTRN